MREELMRRGGLPPRPGLPGLPPHDPYLEASRRYAQAAGAAAGLPSPYGRKCPAVPCILAVGYHDALF